MREKRPQIELQSMRHCTDRECVLCKRHYTNELLSFWIPTDYHGSIAPVCDECAYKRGFTVTPRDLDYLREAVARDDRWLKAQPDYQECPF